MELSALTAHVNVINLDERFELQRGDGAIGSMELNLQAAREIEERTGRPIVAQINHPNYGWVVTAEAVARIPEARFMEVYNGHPLVDNYGDDQRIAVERMWDIVLTLRLGELDLGRVFGIAVDDAHEYVEVGGEQALPGRGWVDVRSPELTPEAILGALESGDFYASTGVTLQDVRLDGGRYVLEIDAEPGVSYRTYFIGTRRGYDPAREPVLSPAGDTVPTTWRFSDEVGEVLSVVEGASATYEFDGDELYVRARVVSDRAKENRVSPDEEWEKAWTQPVRPASESREHP